ncbi:MAG TPA: aspartate/glutamate racemase family protein [Bacteroidales bacterium]|jgi:aspartate racemase|nr:aspartate/glutamate racemase family protein [Bacteroidales bacterium]HNZ43359.1 aspartate/glutamate racemase family protein [Bacteroidales bacterium]HOH83514.1 aspartate/glutamate racemase family protein [Bacteroidales bacterium]HPB25514.1 aspartate/glutamate racemase family protein [Bacteroidales bacterium]HPI30202.1 aspartate/glutamate racemase family protein [Bacteroidales bacterium]
MKTIGLLGGTTWESTQDYYRIINQQMLLKAGNRNTAKIVMYSVNFHEVEVLVNAKKYDEVGSLMNKAALAIEKAGADCLLICANTMHMVADGIMAGVHIPLIHIVDETIKEIKRNGYTKVGLLATRQTMEMDFYKERCRKNGVEIVIPGTEDRDFIQATIFNELFNGIISESSRERMLGIMKDMEKLGTQGVILGCTEIPLLIKQEHTDIPVFDSTYIHSCAAVDFALNN